MKIEDIKLSLYKYKFSSFKIILNSLKEPFDVPEEFVSSVIIEKDFDKYYMPFFQVDVTVPNSIYREMKKADTEITVNLNLQCLRTGDVLQTSSQPAKSVEISGNFYGIIDTGNIETNETTMVNKEKNDGTYLKGYSYSEMTSIQLLLYNKAFYNNSTKIVNAILTTATPVTALTYVLNKAGLKDVVLSPVKNNKSYKEFRVTPLSAIEQVERICNRYGIHTNGSTIFMDTKYFYIIDKSPQCTAYTSNEIRKTYLVSLTKTNNISNYSRGAYKNNAEKYNVVNIAADTLSIKDMSAVSGQSYGDNITIIDTATGRVSNINANGKANGPNKVVTVNGGEVTAASLERTLKETSNVLTAGFAYCPIDMFSPNKEFVLYIDDPKLKKYNGSYRITRMVCVLTRDDQYFVPNITAEFRK